MQEDYLEPSRGAMKLPGFHSAPRLCGRHGASLPFKPQFHLMTHHPSTTTDLCNLGEDWEKHSLPGDDDSEEPGFNVKMMDDECLSNIRDNLYRSFPTLKVEIPSSAEDDMSITEAECTELYSWEKPRDGSISPAFSILSDLTDDFTEPVRDGTLVPKQQVVLEWDLEDGEEAPFSRSSSDKTLCDHPDPLKVFAALDRMFDG